MFDIIFGNFFSAACEAKNSLSLTSRQLFDHLEALIKHSSFKDETELDIYTESPTFAHISTPNTFISQNVSKTPVHTEKAVYF